MNIQEKKRIVNHKKIRLTMKNLPQELLRQILKAL